MEKFKPEPNFLERMDQVETLEDFVNLLLSARNDLVMSSTHRQTYGEVAAKIDAVRRGKKDLQSITQADGIRGAVEQLLPGDPVYNSPKSREKRKALDIAEVQQPKDKVDFASLEEFVNFLRNQSEQEVIGSSLNQRYGEIAQAVEAVRNGQRDIRVVTRADGIRKSVLNMLADDPVYNSPESKEARQSLNIPDDQSDIAGV